MKIYVVRHQGTSLIAVSFLLLDESLLRSKQIIKLLIILISKEKIMWLIHAPPFIHR